MWKFIGKLPCLFRGMSASAQIGDSSGTWAPVGFIEWSIRAINSGTLFWKTTPFTPNLIQRVRVWELSITKRIILSAKTTLWSISNRISTPMRHSAHEIGHFQRQERPSILSPSSLRTSSNWSKNFCPCIERLPFYKFIAPAPFYFYPSMRITEQLRHPVMQETFMMA